MGRWHGFRIDLGTIDTVNLDPIPGAACLDGVPLTRQGTVAGGGEVRVLWWVVAAHALICVFDAGVGVGVAAGGMEGFGG